MKEIYDPMKEKIREYAIKYPMYYDLLEYVLKLEKEIENLKKEKKQNEKNN